MDKIIAEISRRKSYTDPYSWMAQVATAVGRQTNPYTTLLGIGSAHRALSTMPKNLYSDYPKLSQLGMGTTHSLSQIFAKKTYGNHLDRSILSLITPLHKMPSYYHELLASNEQIGRIRDNQRIMSTVIGGLSSINRHKLSSIDYLMRTVATRVATNSVLEETEDIDVVEEITSRIAEVTTEIYKRGFITLDDLKRIKEDVVEYINSISKSDWQFLISLLVAFLMWRFPYTPTSTTSTAVVNSQAATKEDLERYSAEMHTLYSKLTEQKGVAKKVNTDVILRAEPFRKAMKLGVVPCQSDVTVLDINSEWAYITFVNPTDNLPDSGWISTKYFCKSHFSKTFVKRAKKK